MLKTASRALEWLLEWFTIFLMVVLTITVIAAVIARLLGSSFSWYDEVAAIMLSWITYYGSALAALKRRHIGFDSVLLALPGKVRMAAAILAEAVVIGFFGLLAWAGWTVLAVLQGMTLVSLTWVPVQFTQSVIPIGAALFIICQLLSMPHYLSMVARGISFEHPEIDDETGGGMRDATAHSEAGR